MRFSKLSVSPFTKVSPVICSNNSIYRLLIPSTISGVISGTSVRIYLGSHFPINHSRTNILWKVASAVPLWRNDPRILLSRNNGRNPEYGSRRSNRSCRHDDRTHIFVSTKIKATFLSDLGTAFKTRPSYISQEPRSPL